MKYFRKQNSIINDEWYSSLIAFDEKSYYELGLDDFRELYLMAKESNISPDQYVNKGTNRPTFSSNLRMEALASIDAIDY